MKKFIIEGVLENSILDEMEIEAGDKLLTINKTQIMDVLDYRYLIADETLMVEIEKPDGEIWELEIEKDFEEDLGVLFTEEMIGTKTCKNNCIFCFIDQLPKGMRESLYVKDDDERLSFLTGNYITMTNLTKAELDRIIRYRIMPMNLSIHTTNPELRCKMLNNRFAGDVMSYLDAFKANGIQMNGQIVLVPGYNDDLELIKTLADLKAYYPTLQSVSVVPVGISRHRQGLLEIKGFDQAGAQRTIDIINKIHTEMEEKFGDGFVYPSDEFFLKAGVSIPGPTYYNGFPQIENGVGMLSDFEESFNEGLESWLHKGLDKKFFPKVGIVTGTAAYDYLRELIKKMKKKIPEIDVEIYALTNDFFGEAITVSGLMTGQDIIEQLKPGLEANPRDILLIPENALRSGTNILLDDWTLETLGQALDIKAVGVPVNGESLILRIISEEE
ncbi:DUF512 domain-containing protein [Acetobacterium bakii]|nr:DUF512 domain-containing protein [Acetobacterium bakii]